jgi:hypothetical protein
VLPAGSGGAEHLADVAQRPARLRLEAALDRPPLRVDADVPRDEEQPPAANGGRERPVRLRDARGETASATRRRSINREAA